MYEKGNNFHYTVEQNEVERLFWQVFKGKPVRAASPVFGRKA